MQRAGAKVAAKATEIAGRKRRKRSWCWLGRATMGAMRGWRPNCLKAGQRVTVVPVRHGLGRGCRQSRAAFPGPKGGDRETPDPIDADVIVDGLFGMGSHVRRMARALGHRAANASGVPILAIDIPSGLNADSGRCRCGHPCTR